MAANSKFAVATHIMTLIAFVTKHKPAGLLTASGHIKSDLIATSVNTNPVVVRRLAADLVRSGLLIGHQGRGGGLELGRPAEKINLYDIYAAIDEGQLFALNPNKAFSKCPVSKQMGDVLRPIFRDGEEGVMGHLSSIALSELVAQIS
jgi:DNA-binding IscR family transcriptional regulator